MNNTNTHTSPMGELDRPASRPASRPNPVNAATLLAQYNDWTAENPNLPTSFHQWANLLANYADGRELDKGESAISSYISPSTGVFYQDFEMVDFTGDRLRVNCRSHSRSLVLTASAADPDDPDIEEAEVKVALSIDQVSKLIAYLQNVLPQMQKVTR